MKKIGLVLAGLALVALAGCESRTDYGSCVGIGQHQNPKLDYQLSVRNLIIGIITFELIVPPIIVVSEEMVCPVGPAPVQNTGTGT